jgi:thiamine pyrophosphokinase
MRAIIFANGELSDPSGVQDLLRPGDLIVAADGGTRHALAAGVSPHIVIGDLDSLPPDVQAQVESAGACIVHFSPNKNETDLELALLHAAQAGVTEIIILAALGGRLDQTIANLLLLTLPELRGIDVRIVEGHQAAFLIPAGGDGVLIDGRAGPRPHPPGLAPLRRHPRRHITRSLAYSHICKLADLPTCILLHLYTRVLLDLHGGER